MFPKKKRLTRKLFNRFFASGKRFHASAFTLIYTKQTDSAEPYHVAASVGKKVHKSAVKRNRLRRQMYHALRESDIKEGVYIVIAKPSATDVSYEAIVGQIKKLVQSAS